MSNSLAIYENFGQTKEIATALSNSDLVPPHFQKKPANVLIALEFAYRNDIAPFAAMQSMFVVHGRVGMSAAMAISLARKHNVWRSLRYKVEGKGESLSVTAIATMHDDTEVEATVTMQMANIAGWTKSAIYKSIPEQMLKYRAATFLIRSNFPEVLFGMQTVEELNDVDAAKKAIPVNPTPKVVEEPVAVDPIIEAVVEEPIVVETSQSEVVDAEVGVTSPSKIDPEGSNVEAEMSLEDMRDDLLSFIKTLPDAWFSSLGKIRGNLVSVVEREKTVDGMKLLYKRTMEYDDQFKGMK